MIAYLLVAVTLVDALPPALLLVCDKVYGVQKHETCFAVSQAEGLSLKKFLRFNPNINCNNLFIGQWQPKLASFSICGRRQLKPNPPCSLAPPLPEHREDEKEKKGAVEETRRMATPTNSSATPRAPTPGGGGRDHEQAVAVDYVEPTLAIEEEREPSRSSARPPTGRSCSACAGNDEPSSCHGHHHKVLDDMPS
nr:unnamed protein product [Digitaria exilis]